MFDPLNIYLPPNTKIAVVGDIHEQQWHFKQLVEKIQPSPNMLLISAGDIYDRGEGEHIAEQIVDYFIQLSEQKSGYVIKGNHELKHINLAQREKVWSSQLYWMAGQSLVLSFVFANHSRATVLHGGITPKHTWNDLNFDVSTSYIRTIDENGDKIILKRVKKNNITTLEPEKIGKSWHQLYDGRFGYILAGHDIQLDGIPKFYNYSCNLDTGCYSTGILTCQIYDQNGLQDLIHIKK